MLFRSMTQQIPSLGFGRIGPLSNITPFTYRDGETYLSELQRLKDYIQNVLYKETVKEIDGLIDTVNTALSNTENVVQKEFDKISQQIVEITDRAGIPPIHRETISAGYTLDPLLTWSRDHPVYVSLRQDVNGQRSVTLGEGVKGFLDVDQAPLAATNFWLIPTGNTWTIQQPDSGARGGRNDSGTTALVNDPASQLRVSLDTLIAKFTATAKAEINRDVTRQWSDLSARITRLEKA